MPKDEEGVYIDTPDWDILWCDSPRAVRCFSYI
jgi:hypothetical protein